MTDKALVERAEQVLAIKPMTMRALATCLTCNDRHLRYRLLRSRRFSICGSIRVGPFRPLYLYGVKRKAANS